MPSQLRKKVQPRRQAKTIHPRIDQLTPSPWVRMFATKVADASLGKPILDVACGSGRNAIFLASLGCSIVCVDRDLTTLQNQKLPPLISRQLSLRQLDLIKDSWPFGQSTVGGIVNVHFLLSDLLPFFENSLSPGGYLLLETVPGHGKNYLELPKAQELKGYLEKGFEI
jgi:SAM-dependent methyltransferase